VIISSDRATTRPVAAAVLAIARAVAVMESVTTAAVAVPADDEGADCPVSLSGSLTANGRCLGAVGQGTADGTRLRVYDSGAGGQANQQWTIQ
jgi:hypothetical protein